MTFGQFFALFAQFVQPKLWEQMIEAMGQYHGNKNPEFQVFMAQAFFWGGPDKLEMFYAEVRLQNKQGFWASAIGQLVEWGVKLPEDILALAEAPVVAEAEAAPMTQATEQPVAVEPDPFPGPGKEVDSTGPAVVDVTPPAEPEPVAEAVVEAEAPVVEPTPEPVVEAVVEAEAPVEVVAEAQPAPVAAP